MVYIPNIYGYIMFLNDNQIKKSLHDKSIQYDNILFCNNLNLHTNKHFLIKRKNL